MTQEKTSNFSTICIDKSNNKKMNQWEFFNSVFSYRKLRDSSLKYFPVFVAFYLKLVENNDKMQESTFFSS